jgi:hypothetical protein
MLRVGFECMIPVFKRAKTFHALDRAAAVMQNFLNIFRKETLLACSIFKIENHCFLQCDSQYCLYPEDRSSISVNGGSMFSDAFALTYQTARCHNLEDHNMKLKIFCNTDFCSKALFRLFVPQSGRRQFVVRMNDAPVSRFL